MITGNEPVNPTPIAGGDNSVVSHFSMGNSAGVEQGLTIRQHLASLFTASFIQSHQNGNPLLIEENAKLGVAQADALIAELNKEK